MGYKILFNRRCQPGQDCPAQGHGRGGSADPQNGSLDPEAFLAFARVMRVATWIHTMASATAITLLTAPALAQRGEVDIERPGRSESAAAQPAAPKAVSSPPAPGSPRMWPIVVGSIVLVPSYGGALYLAISGTATSVPRVPEGTNFGSPIWLYL